MHECGHGPRRARAAMHFWCYSSSPLHGRLTHRGFLVKRGPSRCWAFTGTILVSPESPTLAPTVSVDLTRIARPPVWHEERRELFFRVSRESHGLRARMQPATSGLKNPSCEGRSLGAHRIFVDRHCRRRVARETAGDVGSFSRHTVRKSDVAFPVEHFQALLRRIGVSFFYGDICWDV